MNIAEFAFSIRLGGEIWERDIVNVILNICGTDPLNSFLNSILFIIFEI